MYIILYNPKFVSHIEMKLLIKEMGDVKTIVIGHTNPNVMPLKIIEFPKK